MYIFLKILQYIFSLSLSLSLSLFLVRPSIRARVLLCGNAAALQQRITNDQRFIVRQLINRWFRCNSKPSRYVITVACAITVSEYVFAST